MPPFQGGEAGSIPVTRSEAVFLFSLDSIFCSPENRVDKILKT